MAKDVGIFCISYVSGSENRSSCKVWIPTPSRCGPDIRRQRTVNLSLKAAFIRRQCMLHRLLDLSALLRSIPMRHCNRISSRSRFIFLHHMGHFIHCKLSAAHLRHIDQLTIRREGQNRLNLQQSTCHSCNPADAPAFLQKFQCIHAKENLGIPNQLGCCMQQFSPRASLFNIPGKLENGQSDSKRAAP